MQIQKPERDLMEEVEKTVAKQRRLSPDFHIHRDQSVNTANQNGFHLFPGHTHTHTHTHKGLIKPDQHVLYSGIKRWRSSPTTVVLMKTKTEEDNSLESWRTLWICSS